ncbi:MAG: Peptidase S46 [Bacteroidetes bacterium ADurb.Bin408]|nr:MAG: Peptidase S46 [Bacteroidetes bacterium ADurb.Bin408]
MKKLLLFFVIAFSCIAVRATNPPDEGMWLPMFIEKLNYKDMQRMGLKLTPEQVYSVNNSSLKDAVVGLGSNQMPTGFFCTAEIVSPEGLLFTNHHCVYDMVQKHSTVENDYLTKGFWSQRKEDEIPNEGATASILYRMEDVTERVFADVKPEMNDQQRSSKIREAISKIEKEAAEGGKYTVNVKSFFSGNEYYLMVYEVYEDVRLVGAPPSSIGKFGGDTDNWMWPRHTGDFGILRIYTGPDGKPAKYSKDNVPLKPRHFLPVSIKGLENNDYTMIWGFPGTTDRYLTSWGVKQDIDINNPATVKIRDKKLAIMKEDMDKSDAIRIKYASKYAQTANYWKYFIGQTRGLKRLNVYEKKQKLEKDFTDWVNASDERKNKYGQALKLIEEGYTEMEKYTKSITYLNEAAFQGPELIFFCIGAMQLHKYLESHPKAKNDETALALAQEFKKSLNDHFKDYNLETVLR